MENLNDTLENNTGNTVKKRKSPISLIWVFSVVIFCLIFAATLAPRPMAQSRVQQDASQYINTLRSVFEFIQRNYVEEVDPKLLFDGAMTGMFESLGDPYSAFLPESEMTSLTDTTQGNFGGVGMHVFKPAARPDGRPSFLEVAAPIEDTPAWRAGIMPGDQIILINGEPTDVISSDEAVSRLRGVPGTDVEIMIRRDETIEFPVTLTRAIIEVPTVRHAMIDNIGYLNLLTFTPMTVERSVDAIQEFQSRGYRGVVLDLRNNYGGLLDSAVAIANLFADGRIVTSTRSRINSQNRDYIARSRAMVPMDIPIIVLINRGSASASEIVAGALKDWGRAFLVGERTFGKGSVQQVFPLENSGFRITTARYYTPSGADIDSVGIPPDREVRLPEFSEADAPQANILINSGRIADFVRENPSATAAQVENFAQALHREFNLELILLRRLIRNEQNRRTIAPIYDLEYDLQLLEAINILRDGSFDYLMQNSRTLRVLQEEAAKVETISLAS